MDRLSCLLATLWGHATQREVELRDDVLVYSTRVLEQAVEVTGPIEAVRVVFGA